MKILGFIIYVVVFFCLGLIVEFVFEVTSTIAIMVCGIMANLLANDAKEKLTE